MNIQLISLFFSATILSCNSNYSNKNILYSKTLNNSVMIENSITYDVYRTGFDNYKLNFFQCNYQSFIAQKELIAVVVSSINRCWYCCVSHTYTLGKLLKDKQKAKIILINYRSANISKKYLTMLDFVCKLTKSSHLIDDNDRNILRKAKFSEKQILEIIEVTAFFNMTNRIASGTNMVPNHEYYN